MEGDCWDPRRRNGDEGDEGEGADFCERSDLPLPMPASANEDGGNRCASGERWSMVMKSVADGKMVAVAAAMVEAAYGLM